jgi:preprotein translocase subunit YajC
MMQPEPTSATQSSDGSAAHGGSAQQPSAANQMQMFLLPVLMFVVFYFLMLRPQQKKQRETEDMIKALKRGDVVRTSGGIRGEITDLSDHDVTLLIADKVKINVLRAHIAGPAANKAAEATKDKT